MFIYREAYYNLKQTEVTSPILYIAKHRNGPTGKVELYFHPERCVSCLSTVSTMSKWYNQSNLWHHQSEQVHFV